MVDTLHTYSFGYHLERIVDMTRSQRLHLNTLDIADKQTTISFNLVLRM